MIWAIVVGCVFILAWPIICIGAEIMSTIKKNKLEEYKQIAYVCKRVEFDKLFKSRNGIYVDKNSKRVYYCIDDENDIHGRRFNKVILGENANSYLWKLYEKIENTRLIKEDNK